MGEALGLRVQGAWKAARARIGRRGARMQEAGMEGGRVLTTSKRMARRGQLACTTAGRRVIGRAGRRAWSDGAQRKEGWGEGGPEIDARVKVSMAMYNGRADGAAQCRAARGGYGTTDKVLMEPVSVAAWASRGRRGGRSVSWQRRTCTSCAWRRAGKGQVHVHASCPSAAGAAQRAAARVPGQRFVDTQLLAAVKRLQNATWAGGVVSGRGRGACAPPWTCARPHKQAGSAHSLLGHQSRREGALDASRKAPPRLDSGPPAMPRAALRVQRRFDEQAASAAVADSPPSRLAAIKAPAARAVASSGRGRTCQRRGVSFAHAGVCVVVMVMVSSAAQRMAGHRACHRHAAITALPGGGPQAQTTAN